MPLGTIATHKAVPDQVPVLPFWYSFLKTSWVPAMHEQNLDGIVEFG